MPLCHQDRRRYDVIREPPLADDKLLLRHAVLYYAIQIITFAISRVTLLATPAYMPLVDGASKELLLVEAGYAWVCALLMFDIDGVADAIDDALLMLMRTRRRGARAMALLLLPCRRRYISLIDHATRHTVKRCWGVKDAESVVTPLLRRRWPRFTPRRYSASISYSTPPWCLPTAWRLIIAIARLRCYAVIAKMPMALMRRAVMSAFIAAIRAARARMSVARGFTRQQSVMAMMLMEIIVLRCAGARRYDGGCWWITPGDVGALDALVLMRWWQPSRHADLRQARHVMLFAALFGCASIMRCVECFMTLLRFIELPHTLPPRLPPLPLLLPIYAEDTLLHYFIANIFYRRFHYGNIELSYHAAISHYWSFQ